MSCDIAERLHESRNPTAPSAKDRIINYEELQEKNRQEVEEERQANKGKKEVVIYEKSEYQKCQEARNSLLFRCADRCWGSNNNTNCVAICESQFEQCKK